MQVLVLAGPGETIKCQPLEDVVLKWTVANSGSEPWPEGTVLRQVDGPDLKSGQPEIQCPAVPAGFTLEIQMTLKAPAGHSTVSQSFAFICNAIGSEPQRVLTVTLDVATDASRGRYHPHAGLRPGNHTRLLKMMKHEPKGVMEDEEDVVPVRCVQESGWEWVAGAQTACEVPAHFREGEKINSVSFKINGEMHKIVEGTMPVTTSLAEYIRYYAGLTGTKIGCREGGCGACTVVLHDGSTSRVANSCLKPVLAVDGFEIITTEGLGSYQRGYHKVQDTMSKCFGSQCGMCTPGMVMSIFGFFQKETAKPSQDLDKEAESCIQGNICRCTGYRPIYKAIHQLVEEVKSGIPVAEACVSDSPRAARRFALSDNSKTWFNCVELKDVRIALLAAGLRPHRLVVGNTSVGVIKYYPHHVSDSPEVFINVARVPEMQKVSVGESSVAFGASCTLSQVIDVLNSLASRAKNPISGFEAIVSHLKLVAHPQVRDMGSWAGNLMMAKTHPDFPSDVCLLMTTLRAQITIMGPDEKTLALGVTDFLAKKMDVGEFVTKITIPYPEKDDVVVTFKVMKRHMNTHAEVNAGFHFKFNRGGAIQDLRIVLGNLSLGPLVCAQTPLAVAGKELSMATLKEGIAALAIEARVAKSSVEDPPFAVVSEKYRMDLAMGLFYKAWLRAIAAKQGITAISPQLQSASVEYQRPISKGAQSYSVAPEEAPLGQAIQKVEGHQQAAGEIKYTGDTPWPARTVVGVQVHATTIGRINHIDVTAALAMPGVVGFMAAQDLKAHGWKNKLADGRHLYSLKKTKFVGQVIGLLVANSFEEARQAAAAVVVEYETNEAAQQVPVVHADPHPIKSLGAPPKGSLASRGKMTTTGQKHFQMETMCALAQPDGKGGVMTYGSLHDARPTLSAVLSVLNLPESKVDVRCTRLGGCYGSKVFGSFVHIAQASAAALHFDRPVFIYNDWSDEWSSMGGRWPCHAKWDISYTPDGKISALTQNVKAEAGSGNVQMPITQMNAYDIELPNFATDWISSAKAANTIMRAPGETQGSLFMEASIEHMARDLGVEQTLVQLKNLPQPTYGLYIDMLEAVQYEQKRAAVTQFNKAHRWRKRGLYSMPGTYNCISLFYQQARITVNADGTVNLALSATEMGNGLNTKCVQALGSVFKYIAADFDIADVTVLPVDARHLNAKSTMAGASMGSEDSTRAALNASELIAQKLVKYKGAGRSWKEVVSAAIADGVDITALGKKEMWEGADLGYECQTCCCVVAEIDVLTGETQIISADCYEGGGKSLNPGIDIGQMEGCFMMVLGLCLTEEQVFSPVDHRLVSKGTWDYKVPSGLDIPQNWNIKLVPGTDNRAIGNVRGSKASGEMVITSSNSIFWAVKDAIYAARKDAGQEGWFELDIPASVNRVQQAALAGRSMSDVLMA